MGCCSSGGDVSDEEHNDHNTKEHEKKASNHGEQSKSIDYQPKILDVINDCEKDEVKEPEPIKEDEKVNHSSPDPPVQKSKSDKAKKKFLQKIEADRTILLIGEEACGKTSFVKLLLNVLKNNPIEEIEFNSEDNCDFISNYENCIMSEEYNLSEGSNPSSLTKGLRFYVEKDETSSKKLLIIDTPGIKITRNSELDAQYLELITEVFKLKKIDYILFVQKADSNKFSLSVNATLEKLAENLKEYNYNILILLTFYAGTKVFNSSILPFDQNLIKKQYALDNQIFLINQQTLKQKPHKFKGSYEISDGKAKKIIKLILEIN